MAKVAAPEPPQTVLEFRGYLGCLHILTQDFVTLARYLGSIVAPPSPTNRSFPSWAQNQGPLFA